MYMLGRVSSQQSKQASEDELRQPYEDDAFECFREVKEQVNQSNAEFIIKRFSEDVPFGIKAVKDVSYTTIRLIKDIFLTCLDCVGQGNENVKASLRDIQSDKSAIGYQLLNKKSNKLTAGFMSLLHREDLLSWTLEQANIYLNSNPEHIINHPLADEPNRPHRDLFHPVQEDNNSMPLSNQPEAVTSDSIDGTMGSYLQSWINEILSGNPFTDPGNSITNSNL